MKFGKEYVLQMLPEWKEAYIDYAYLKTLLKKTLKSKLKKEHEKSKTKFVRENTLYRAFSGLTHQLSDLNNNGDVEDQVIVVSTLRGDDDFNVCYETKFLNTYEELSDHDIMFFRSLDHEFNKVNKFYREKVEEVMKEAAMLNKQMDVLIALRIKVENPDFDDYSEITHLATDVANNPIISATSTPRSAKTPKMEHTIVIPEATISNERELESIEGVVAGSKHTVNHSNVCEANSNTNTRIPDALEILEHVKLNNTFETPRSTIKAVFKVSKAEELRYNKRELRKVEEQLKQVFIEFHCKLRLLKRYSYMNLLAISKVLKKYDKITSRGASKSYVKAVDTSYVGSSDEVTALLERVETTFIKHFSNSDRRKGMKFLRPKAKKEKHKTTFFLGFFSGNAVALLVALVLIIKARDLMNNEGSTRYMENIFPLYSLFAYIILHTVMYAVNIFFWRRYRVNYTFIFGFKKGTELGYREVFLLSAGLALLALLGVLANLDMEMDPGTRSYKKITELVPLGLITFLLVVTFCPFNIMYRSSRLFFIKSMFRCMCAPLYKVTLPDFFLADQLTSQVQAIRNLEFYICYYGSGLYIQRRNNCRSSDVYNSFYFIVALLPYWCRLLQCLRRLLEEKDPNQGYNGLKYFLTIVAIVMRTSYDLKKGLKWKVLAAISSTIAAIMSTYWDLVMDWGLLQRHSKNRWLRDKLLISNTNVYFIAMVLNIILRLAWLQSVLNFHVSFLHKTALTTIVACLEILRRGMWNFFRLENEHLNNVGKFRAFKSVPLPFNYYDEEEEYSSSSSSTTLPPRRSKHQQIGASANKAWQLESNRPLIEVVG